MTWAPVVGWVGFYEVSTAGEVRSLTRRILRKNGTEQVFRARAMTAFVAPSGYLVVRLRDTAHGRSKMARVHCLVADAFIPNVDSKPEVNHIDGNKANPALENLEWVTPRENRLHAWRTGLRNRSHLPIHRGVDNYRAKLTEEQVTEIRARSAAGTGKLKLAKEFGLSKTTVMGIVRRTTWAHLPSPPPGGASDV